MWSSDELDVFTIESWNSTFTSLNSWHELRNKAKSGMARFVVGASLAAVAMQSLAHDENLAIADVRTNGPPISFQNITKSIDLPVILPDDQTDEAPLALEGPEGQPYNSATLNAELKKIRDIRRSLIDLVSINDKTIRVAGIIAHQIPAPINPSIGFDEAGNIFLHFKHEKVDAYLTIEQHALHLFCKVVGQRNIYIDNEPFFGKRLPTKIRDKLSEIFVA